MQPRTRWFLVLCAVPSMLLGQASGRTLKAGDRVRIAAAADTGTFIVRAVSPETLTVQLPRSTALAYFPVTTLRRVDVSRGRENFGVRVLRLTVIGGLVGGAIGGLAGLAEGDNRGQTGLLQGSRTENATFYAAVFGAAGSMLGGITGLLTRGEHWERVSLPSRVSATTPANGVFALSYSF